MRAHYKQLPENITLIQLPAYSPKLNPIENRWYCLRSRITGAIVRMPITRSWKKPPSLRGNIASWIQNS
uniref:hypothetical protein n=1 Tax=Polystyrenella longa TaxID=2528007 RepID=UPI0011A2D69D